MQDFYNHGRNHGNPSNQPVLRETSTSTSESVLQQAKLQLPSLKPDNFLRRALEDLEMGPVRGRDLKRSAAASSLPLWSSTDSSETDCDSNRNLVSRLPRKTPRRRTKRASHSKRPVEQESDSTDLVPWWRDSPSPWIINETTSSTTAVNENQSSSESLNIFCLSNQPPIFSNLTPFSTNFGHKMDDEFYPVWRNRILASQCKSNPEAICSSNPQHKPASIGISSILPRSQNHWDDDDSLWSKSSEELQVTGKKCKPSLTSVDANENILPQRLVKRQSVSEFPGFIRIYPISVSSCGVHANYPLDTSDTDLFYSEDPFYVNTRQFVAERMAEMTGPCSDGVKEQKRPTSTQPAPVRPYSSSFQTCLKRPKNKKRNATQSANRTNDSQIGRHNVMATTSVP